MKDNEITSFDKELNKFLQPKCLIIQETPSLMICTHFPGHILFTSLNTWMLPCILQGASILFFSESFCYCNS